MRLTDGGPARGGILRPIVPAFGDNDGDDSFADAHANRADHHQRLAADFVDVDDGGDGGGDVDDADDAGGEERGGAAGEAERLKDDGGVVNDWVDLSV